MSAQKTTIVAKGHPTFGTQSLRRTLLASVAVRLKTSDEDAELERDVLSHSTSRADVSEKSDLRTDSSTSGSNYLFNHEMRQSTASRKY